MHVVDRVTMAVVVERGSVAVYSRFYFVSSVATYAVVLSEKGCLCGSLEWTGAVIIAWREREILPYLRR